MTDTGAPATAGLDRARSLLAARRALSRRPLGLAAGSTAANALFLVVQYGLLASVVDDVVFAGADLARVWPRLCLMLAALVIRAVFVWLGECASVEAAARVKQAIRTDLMARLMALGPVRLAGERSGALAAVLVEGVEALEPYYARFLPAMVGAALVPLAMLAVVVPSDWLSGLFLAGTAPLIPLAMVLIGRGAERLNQRQWAKLARMSAHFLEVLQGLTTLKLFNASRREADLVARLSGEYRSATMTVLRVAFLSALALEFFATFGIALVAVFIGFRLYWGHMAFERGLFVLLLAPEFYLPLRSLGTHYHARMEAIAAAAPMAELLGRSVPAWTGEAPVVAERTAPGLCFEDVGLVYEGGRRGLAGASFELRPGTVTALVGPSGAGKSSVVNLLLGFVTPSEGAIRVDGRPLAETALPEWRRRIAWVPQRSHLFVGTVAENLRLGSPETSDEALVTAARLTGADDFIRALPGGYHCVIGEGGRSLSGGQARLVALTRAILRPAPFLILDEPTASLDEESERRINGALSRLASGKTVLIIAHRLQTVRSADLILVLEDGRVVEQGRHEALAAQGGRYAALMAAGEFLPVPEERE